MPISAVLPSLAIENTLDTASAARIQRATAAAAATTTATAVANSTPTSTTDTVSQDAAALLKTLASGDAAGAKTDLAKLKADLKAQEATETSRTNLNKDATAAAKALASGNTPAAKADFTQLQINLKADGTSTPSGTQTANPLTTVVRNISDSLNSGNTQGALQALATHLVQNGQSIGGLVNTSA